MTTTSRVQRFWTSQKTVRNDIVMATVVVMPEILGQRL